MQLDVKDVRTRIERYICKDEIEKAITLANFASRKLYENGNLKNAINFSLISAKLNTEKKNFFGAGWAYKWSANISKSLGNLEDAIEFAKIAIRFFEHSNSKYAKILCYKLIADIYTELGDFENAIKYYRMYLNEEIDEEVEKRLNNLMQLINAPTVHILPERVNIKIGERIRVRVVVKNTSNTLIKNVNIYNNKGESLMFTESLNKKRSKIFIVDFFPNKLGKFEIPIKKVEWEGKNNEYFEKEIKKTFIDVYPDIEIKKRISNIIKKGYYSYLTISFRNRSPEELKDFEVRVIFTNMRVKPLSDIMFSRIAPGDIVHVTYKLLPISENNLKFRIIVKCKDKVGNKYKLNMGTYSLLEIESVNIERLEKAKKEYFKTNIDIHEKFEELEIGEKEFMKRIDKLKVNSINVKIKDINVEDVYMHILHELNFSKFISSYDYGTSKLLLLAFSEKSSNSEYLLSIAIKKKDNNVLILFKMFSNNENTKNILKVIVNNVMYSIETMRGERNFEKIKRNKMERIMETDME